MKSEGKIKKPNESKHRRIKQKKWLIVKKIIWKFKFIMAKNVSMICVSNM